MQSDEESCQPLPLPKVLPQTIPELSYVIVTKFDHRFGALEKRFQAIKLERPEIEKHHDGKRKLPSVDLQRCLDRLQREVDIIDLILNKSD